MMIFLYVFENKLFYKHRNWIVILSNERDMINVMISVGSENMMFLGKIHFQSP